MQGSRFFTAGAVLFVLTGIAHSMAHLQPPPADAKSVFDTMAGYRQTIGGLTFSIQDGVNLMSWYQTVLSILVGVLALVMRSAYARDARTLRRASMLHAAGALVLTGLGIAYGVMPPVLFFAVAGVLFAIAAARAR